MANGAGPINMQGIIVPQAALNPEQFARMTRPQRNQFRTNVPWQGPGSTETIEIPQNGILSSMRLTVSGTYVVTTAAVTPTFRWPYDLIRQMRFSANGQSNLISLSGAKLKAREIMNEGVVNDRGVARSIGGSVRSQGTMSQDNEAWGVFPGTPAAPGSYDFQLSFQIPVAFERKFLTGAILAQTSSTQLNLAWDWQSIGGISSIAANTALTNVTYTLEGEVFPIPYDGGVAILPDLSSFHFLTQITDSKVAIGENEFRIMGQGSGKQLMRLYFQMWNGAASAPLSLTRTATTQNIPSVGWRFGGSDMPQRWAGGHLLAIDNEVDYGSNLGQYWGFGVLDWADKNAFRDSIDESSATELRFFVEIGTGVTLVNSSVEYVREEMMSGPSGI